MYLFIFIKMQSFLIFSRRMTEDMLSTQCTFSPYSWISGALMAPRYLFAALTLLLNSNLISNFLIDS